MSPANPSAKPIQQVLDLLDNVRPSGNGWTALCPAHGDRNNSLSAGQGKDGRVLIYCHAGCDAPDILAALGLEFNDLFARNQATERRRSSQMPETKVEAVYSYCDEADRLLYQVVRYPGKVFRQRRPGLDGNFIYDLKGVRRVLYNLREVLTATHVVVAEGEKDANRVKEALPYFKKREGVRWAVTTCPGGAENWRAEYAPYFKGKCAFILPDNDKAGRKFGQGVARSVSAFARRVKIVELPDLPEKGDVSDYLDDHYARDLQGELRKAPLYKGTNSYIAESDRNSFNLQSLRDCFDAREEEQQWLVEGFLPAGGMSVISAKPKVGKSTIARQLALNVATGKAFLGRETQQGEVIYFALEEKWQEVTNHFRDLGATGNEPIRIHCGSAPIAAMEEARVLLQQQQPALLIIDPLFKFARVKDGNDYAQMTAALEPILALARETGTHIFCVHHSGKGERADPTDAILGSTAIFGNVDTAVMLAKYDGYRTISSCQRYGEDVPETVLEFNPDRRAVKLGASRDQAEQDSREQQILKFLESRPGALEADILTGVVGRRKNKVSDLRNLVGTRVQRQGKGWKADPYRYFAVSRSRRDSDSIAGTRTQNSSQDITSKGKIVVPEAEEISGNKNRAGNLVVPASAPRPLGRSLPKVGSMKPARAVRTRETKRKRSKWADIIPTPTTQEAPILEREQQSRQMRKIAETGERLLVPKLTGTSRNNNYLAKARGSGSSRLLGGNSEFRVAFPSAFEEQVAILEVDGGLTRAEAERSVRASMRKRPVN